MFVGLTISGSWNSVLIINISGDNNVLAGITVTAYANSNTIINVLGDRNSLGGMTVTVSGGALFNLSV